MTITGGVAGGVTAVAAPSTFLRPAPKNIWPSSKGDLILTTPGDIVEDYDVHARILLHADGTGARDCITRGLDTGIGYNSGLIDATGPYSGHTVENVLGVPTVPSVWWQGVILGHDFYARQIEGYHLVDGFGIYNTHGPDANIDLENFYIHDHYYNAKDPNHGGGPDHGDGIQIQQGNKIHIANGYLTGLTDPIYGGYCNSAMEIAGGVGPITNLDISNVIVGGGWFSTINISDPKGDRVTGSIKNLTFLPTVNPQKTKGYGYQLSRKPGSVVVLSGLIMADGSAPKIYTGN